LYFGLRFRPPVSPSRRETPFRQEIIDLQRFRQDLAFPLDGAGGLKAADEAFFLILRKFAKTR
jgi:hypothetical protein